MLADKDIDETMAADWAAIREKHTVEDETPDLAGEPEVEAVAPETPESVVDSKPRDESGKFTRAPKESKDAAKSAEQADTSQREPTAAALPVNREKETQSADVNRPPSSWKPTARAEYDKLSPVIKAEIHRREADMSAGAQQLLPDATLGKEMRASGHICFASVDLRLDYG